MPADRPASRPALPAAVSTLVTALVHGEPAAATVVGAHRYVLYLSVRGQVPPVVTSDAVALPTAVRLVVASGSVSWGVVAGDAVRVGGGRVQLPALDVVAARTWRPARVRRTSSCGECAAGCPGDHLRTHDEVGAAVDEILPVQRLRRHDGQRRRVRRQRHQRGEPTVRPPDLTHFVADTSRNRRGPWTPPAGLYRDPQDWCNPPGRGLGIRPTTATGHPLADAFLWVKVPGESDGQCSRGLTDRGGVDPEWGVVDPAAGDWFPQQALELARLAQLPLR